MKKIIFVLSYGEGDLFIKNYRREYFPEDADVIILDNGHQAKLKQWAVEKNFLYHESMNNLGTTGGYNWFIRVAAMMSADRAVVMQADVEILRPETFKLLFSEQWQKNDFVYFPNLSREHWLPNGLDPDIGQLFSIDPKFWLNSGWLCDENYTITHFESIDLYLRITSGRNTLAARPVNLLKEFSRGGAEDQSYYKIHSVSNGAGEHNPWFMANYQYWKQKWGYHTPEITVDQAWQLFKERRLDWADGPWVPSEHPHGFALLHRWTLDTGRNIAVGQLPYPVEEEVNRFYQSLRRSNSLP